MTLEVSKAGSQRTQRHLLVARKGSERRERDGHDGHPEEGEHSAEQETQEQNQHERTYASHGQTDQRGHECALRLTVRQVHEPKVSPLSATASLL
jgi:recombinational DNA repair ATPase RecF